MKKAAAAALAVLLLLTAGCGITEKSSVDVPVLMYHSVGYEENNSYVVTPEQFRRQMELLKENGYTAIDFSQLVDFVENGTALPEKPIVITLDDGYEDNYLNAYPVLKELGMKATVNAVGVHIGKDTYRDTDIAIRSHFSAEQGKEMIASGLIDIQMHSYDLHRVELDEDYRFGAGQLEGESDGEYRELFSQDTLKCMEVLKESFGTEPFVYAYPQGEYNELSEAVLRELGIKVSLTVTGGVNKVTQGDEDSLMAMYRIDVYSTMDDDVFLSSVSQDGM